MFDASDRTTIWGGASLYQVWHKRLQVLVSYTIVAVAISLIAWVILLALSAIVGFPGGVIGSVPISVLIGALVSLLMLIFSKWSSTVGISIGPLADKKAEAKVKTVLESICTQVGVAMPDIGQIDGAAIEVASFARPRKHLIVLSNGAISALSTLELEAVLAREIAKVRSGLSNYDAYLLVPRKLLALITLGAYPESVALPIAQETMLVDLASLAITRFPPALISVLRKFRDEGTFFELKGASAKGSSWLWINPPVISGSKTLLEDRIAQLEEW